MALLYLGFTVLGAAGLIFVLGDLLRRRAGLGVALMLVGAIGSVTAMTSVYCGDPRAAVGLCTGGRR